MSNQLPDLLGNVIEEMILWERLPIPVDYPAPWLVSILIRIPSRRPTTSRARPRQIFLLCGSLTKNRITRLEIVSKQAENTPTHVYPDDANR